MVLCSELKIFFRIEAPTLLYQLFCEYSKAKRILVLLEIDGSICEKLQVEIRGQMLVSPRAAMVYI